MRFRADFVGLLGARGAKLTIGLATMFVYARIFGVSATYDGWIWALGLVNAAGMIFFGPITETIRASYSGIEHQDGQDAAEQYLATVTIIMLSVAALFAMLTFALLPAAATALVDRRSEQGEASIFFLNVLAPSMVISQVVAVLTAYLNCRGKVYPPEIAGIVGGAVGVLFILAFPELPAKWLLPGSYYIGLAAPLLVGASFWPQLARAIARLNLTAFRRYGREALTFSFPLFLPYALGQLSGLIERQYAFQAGTGALAVLSYAFFARNTVQAVFTAALSALAVPGLAREWNPQARGPFRQALRHWTHQCMSLVTMGMMFLFGLSALAPVILFGGEVGAGPQTLLAQLLRAYAIAIIGVVMYLVGGSALLAARKGKSYAVLSAIVSLTSTLLLVALFPVLGLLAIPVSLWFSLPVVGWMMFNRFDRRDGAWVVKVALVRATIVCAGGWLIRLVDILAQDAAVPALGRLLLCCGAGALLCGLWWFLDHRNQRPEAAEAAEGQA